ncbi:MAG: membrane protein insertase YidC [Prevotella sp.]|uniref:membrane protein insertase YidC n=1 Tax=Prevotella sp. P5-92 TaxID=2024222 RepID=UPI000B97823C|nr:membrane protein insertase YidC [Prevotella sp. P5-92]MCI7400589.1 membrane protein insertase YidC [Prevotella sp.]MDD6819388.1 membrane protein insertase YidC [Prevotella sp.]MDY4653194.1 membrane protein insertase YidC [Prevotella sp.]OYP59935.1 membrane protein insertase YidC [Prevotella sp. P5-92]
MNKNTIIGFILMAAVLFGFSWYNQPSEEQINAQRKKDSIENVIKQKAEQQQRAKAAAKQAQAQAALADTTALFHPALTGKNSLMTLKNDKVVLKVATKGGHVAEAKVLGFKDKSGDKDLTLFAQTEQCLNFLLAGKETNIITADLYFTPSNATDSTLTLTAEAGNGGSITIDYRLGKNYLVNMKMRVNGLSGIFAPNYKQVDMEWTGKCRQQEKGYTFENRYATLTYKEKNDDSDYVNETEKVIDEPMEFAIDWLAFKDQFFSSVLIPKGDIAPDSKLSSIPQEKGSGYLKQYIAKFKTDFDPTGAQPTEIEMYFGPNDFQVLKAVDDECSFDKDLDMQTLVYLGWPIVRLINRWFTIYVFDWLTSWGFNMGIVLILLTLLLKAITFPLVKKSYMSSAKMRVLKPKLDEATKQYNKPEDAMMKQQAMMQLYAKYGVSPLGGCLPMLIQMPIWVAMFNFVPNAIQLRGESFLWMDDLSTYDPIVEWGTNIWMIGDHLSLTCVLFCVANILYSMMSMRQQKDQMVGQQAEQMKMMQWMMYLMPLMFFFMFNDYASGLNFYYFISLFFSAAIMWVLRKTTNDEKLLAILEARYKENKDNPKKQSGLAARLEAMQKQAEEMRKLREQQMRK